MQPAKKYLAKAVPHRSQFRGQFALPGHVPDVVRIDGVAVLYKTAEAAELAAAQTLLGMANDRISGLKDLEWHGPPPLAPDDLSTLIYEHDMTPAEFGTMFNTNHVAAWLAGSRRVPHWVRIMLALLKIQGNREAIATINSKGQ